MNKSSAKVLLGIFASNNVRQSSIHSKGLKSYRIYFSDCSVNHTVLLQHHHKFRN